MEHYVMFGGGINSATSNLGYVDDSGKYVIDEDCAECLEEINDCLLQENSVRFVRRQLALKKVATTDLIPILESCDDEKYMETFAVNIKIMMSLTFPNNFILASCKSTEKQMIASVLVRMHHEIKARFQVASIKALVDNMSMIIEHCKSSTDKILLTPEHQTTLHNCIRFLLNLLSIQINPSSKDYYLHVQLLKHNLDQVLIELLQNIKPNWNDLLKSILQLNCLLFTGFTAPNLAEVIPSVLAGKVEEKSDQFSSFQEPDTASDRKRNHKGECQSVSSEKQELRKLLAKYAVDLNRVALPKLALVLNDYESIQTNMKNICFLWNFGFILSFTEQSSVAFADIRYMLSSTLIGCCVMEMMHSWECYQLAKEKGETSTSNINSKLLYLLAAVLNKIFTNLLYFMKKCPDEIDGSLEQIVDSLTSMTEVIDMYLLMIRKFDTNVDSKSYLKELIVGNNQVLTLLSLDEKNPSTRILEHLNRFATKEMMRIYNFMLNDFKTHTLIENESVFNMFYHISADIAKPHLLLQIPILSTFSEIYAEENVAISSESSDLIDYLVGLFGLTCQESPDVFLYPESKKTKMVISRKTKENLEREIIQEVRDTGKDIGGLIIGDWEDIDEEEDPSSLDKMSTSELVSYLESNGMRPQLTKLQNLLLEICYIKLNCPKDSVCQPTTLFSVLENKSVPFICYSEELEEAVKSPAFVNLGQKLGVHVTESSRYFTLIPNFWTAQMCFDAAKKLSDLDYSKLQFETQNHQLLPEQLVGDETRLPDDEYDEGNVSLDSDLKQLSITERFSMTISNSLWMKLVKMQSSQQNA